MYEFTAKKFDFENPDSKAGLIRLSRGLQDMIAGGDEAGAKKIYNEKQAQYGFTNDQFGKFTNGMGAAPAGGFTGKQVGEWSGNPNVSPVANLGMGGGGGGGAAPAVGGGALPAPAVQGGGQPAQQPQQQPSQQPPQNGYGPGGGYQGMPGSAGGRYQPNPYLQQQAQNLQAMSNDNFARNIAPGMRSGAVAAGGFGGSRQGVIEANALKDQNFNLTNSLTNMFAGDFNNSQNRNLQQRQGDQSYDLGLRSNDLGFQNADNSYDLGRRSNDLGYANLDSNNKQFGANLGLRTMDSQANWAQQGVAAGNQMQQTPINYFNNFNNNANAIAGQGSSGNQTVGSTSNPWMQASGAVDLGQQMYDKYRAPQTNGNGGYNYGGVNYNNPSAFGS